MPSDLDRLQGTWKIASLELEGLKLPAMMFLLAKFAVDGNTVALTGLGAEHRGCMELDETTSPKSLRIVFTQGPEEGNTNFGIYELTGESVDARWKICLAIKGGPAPTEFATTSGSGRALEVLKRA